MAEQPMSPGGLIGGGPVSVEFHEGEMALFPRSGRAYVFTEGEWVFLGEFSALSVTFGRDITPGQRAPED